jgi:hypothetical protein
MQYNIFLIFGALLSAVAAVLHIGIVVKGASWYRFFGAGERFAMAAEQNKWWPHVVTLGIAIVLTIWAAYALSGSGLIAPLPFLQETLALITAIYLLRGGAIFPLLMFMRNKLTPFYIWSSVICLGYGIVHAIGLMQIWVSP